MAQAYAILLAFFVCLFCHKNISFASKFNTSTDEASLLALKARITSDPNNYLTTNWSRGTSFCTWNGVTCSRRRDRVVGLDLVKMSLYGTIAPDIGNLSFMRFINLRNNSFTGIIPDEIGNLRRLRSLYMSFNQLSGSIPWSIFNLSSLRNIGFRNNWLSGSLPPNICPHSAAKLETLGLSWNQLVGEIPRSLSQCADLEILSLSYNNFTGSVPVEIENLSKLQLLYLGRNHLTGEDMVAHVADFGISKLLTEDQRMDQTKTLGTIGYMAPEYGSAGLVSTKVDVYSFGILLMETFTKKKPTSEMFVGELTMRGWVSDSYPSTVMEIVDADLVNAENEYGDNKVEECLVSVMELAIQCAVDLPEERPDMKDVLVRLKKINIKLHSTVTEVQHSRVVSQQDMAVV